MVEVINSNSVTLAAGQTIPFATATFDTNDKAYFEPSTNSIVITQAGKYEVNGSFIFAPTGTGTSTITLSAYANGVPIPCDKSMFVSVANNIHTFVLPKKFINVVSSTAGNTVKITFQTDTAGTLSNAVASVNYVR